MDKKFAKFRQNKTGQNIFSVSACFCYLLYNFDHLYVTAMPNTFCCVHPNQHRDLQMGLQ